MTNNGSKSGPTRVGNSRLGVRRRPFYRRTRGLSVHAKELSICSVTMESVRRNNTRASELPTRLLGLRELLLHRSYNILPFHGRNVRLPTHLRLDLGNVMLVRREKVFPRTSTRHRQARIVDRGHGLQVILGGLRDAHLVRRGNIKLTISRNISSVNLTIRRVVSYVQVPLLRPRILNQTRGNTSAFIDGIVGNRGTVLSKGAYPSSRRA